MDVMTGKIANLEMWQDKPELEAALMYPRKIRDTFNSVA